MGRLWLKAFKPKFFHPKKAVIYIIELLSHISEGMFKGAASAATSSKLPFPITLFNDHPTVASLPWGAATPAPDTLQGLGYINHFDSSPINNQSNKKQKTAVSTSMLDSSPFPSTQEDIPGIKRNQKSSTRWSEVEYYAHVLGPANDPRFYRLSKDGVNMLNGGLFSRNTVINFKQRTDCQQTNQELYQDKIPPHGLFIHSKVSASHAMMPWSLQCLLWLPSNVRNIFLYACINNWIILLPLYWPP